MGDRNERRDIIIKEIAYWKQHKLLPAVYCDFLLALYTKGQKSEEELLTYKKNRDLLLVNQIILLILLIPFSLVVIYSTQFQPIMQISVLLLFLAYTCWMLINLVRKQNNYFHIAFVVLLFLILLCTDFLAKLFTFNLWLTLVLILSNFIGWFYIGRKFAFKYLIFASVLGIIITSIYIVL